MVAPSRNAPCPCGSGKKYKKCCLPREQEAAPGAGARATAAEPALGWLKSRHDAAALDAISRDFLATRDEDLPEFLAGLPEEVAQAVEINAFEWLLADGEIEVEGEPRRVAELLLGPGGPPLDAAKRAWIEEMAARPLAFWEVLDSRPGRGLWLRDAHDPEGPRRWVVERSGSQSLRRGDLIGARLMSWGGEWLLSGAIYPLDRSALPLVRGELAAMLEERAGSDPELRRNLLAAAVIEGWLQRLAAPPARPEIVDAGSGDALLLTTDHYRVANWKRLAAVLAQQPDVEGDRKRGWARLEGPSGPVRRSLLALNPGRGDRLEVFARTRRLADEGRAWLAAVAGDAIAFVAREISDPLGGLGDEGAPPRRGGRSAPPPLVKTTELTQAIYEHIYRTWADDPIPIFAGRTPRQMLRTASGREQVADLLRSYEENEEQEARREKREPASFEFLRRAVGLERRV
jgi:hypothetical protein